MNVCSFHFQVQTLGYTDMHDITHSVQELLTQSGLQGGIATVFVPSSTAGITTLEFESGAINDLKRAIERIAPEGIRYDHDARWGDGNGFAHVRAALLGPSLSLPFTRGKLELGTWQQIILIDFDNRPRGREIKVQLVGD